MSLTRPTRPEARGLPEVGARRLQPGGCVEARVVHDSELVQVTAWRCLRDDEALRAERRQTHHVLTLLRTGTCAIEQGRRRTTLDPCTALLHRPGSTYRTLHPHGHGDAGWSLAFADSVADELLRHGPAPRPARAITLAPSVLVAPLLLLQRARLGRAVDELALETAGLDLLRGVLRRAAAEAGAPAGARPSRRRLAERAAELAASRFRERLRLADVARELGCSPCHLARVFREQRGTSFAAHVRELRLGFVVDALAEGREARGGLGGLALAAGFASHAHLSDACARATGWPPSRVRELLGGRRGDEIKFLKAGAAAGGRS